MIGLANPLGLLTLASVAVLIALTRLRRETGTTRHILDTVPGTKPRGRRAAAGKLLG